LVAGNEILKKIYECSPTKNSPINYRHVRLKAALQTAILMTRPSLLAALLRLDPSKLPPPPKNPFVRTQRDKQRQKDEQDPETGKDTPPPKEPPKYWYWVLGMVLAYIALPTNNSASSNEDRSLSRYVSWNEFEAEMLSKGEVKSLKVFPELEEVLIELHAGAVIKGSPVRFPFFRMKVIGINKFEEKLRDAENRLSIPEQGRIKVAYQRSSFLSKLALPMIALGIFFYFMAKASKSVSSGIMGQMDKLTKAKFTIIEPDKPWTGKLTSFKDVAGMQEAKKEVMEFVGYLKDPAKFSELGAKAPRGALLLGPPGCGKTLLARAVACEAQVPFLTMAGSEFVEVVGGLGAARVRDLFKEARKRKPCIVYIDEVDAVGRKRSGSSGAGAGGGSSEEEQTLNQLLVEMDGMTTSEGVIMLASTNRVDILDRALLRPGRFDRQIEIDPPTAEERKAIFEVYLNKLSLAKDPSAYSTKLATRSPGMSGADIANVCNEAALHAAREGQKMVDGQNFDHAIERVVFGPEKKSKILQDEERRVLAYHEAGHALCGWLLEHTDALMKVSIAPRTNSALGFSQLAPSDLKLYSKEQLFDRMCMTLGGRVAELLVFNKVTTGAEDDLKKVTNMAYRQIRLYGMNDKVGNLSFDVDIRQDGNFAIKPYSKALGTVIDAEVSKLVHEAFKVTEDLIRSNRDKLDMVSSNLFTKDVLSYTDLEDLIGAPPFSGKQKVELTDWELFTVQEGGGSGDKPIKEKT